MDFERTLIRCFAGMVCVVALSIAGCTSYANSLIAQNKDPVAASCAIYSSAKACMAYIARDRASDTYNLFRLEP